MEEWKAGNIAQGKSHQVSQEGNDAYYRKLIKGVQNWGKWKNSSKNLLMEEVMISLISGWVSKSSNWPWKVLFSTLIIGLRVGLSCPPHTQSSLGAEREVLSGPHSSPGLEDSPIGVAPQAMEKSHSPLLPALGYRGLVGKEHLGNEKGNWIFVWKSKTCLLNRYSGACLWS